MSSYFIIVEYVLWSLNCTISLCMLIRLRKNQYKYLQLVNYSNEIWKYCEGIYNFISPFNFFRQFIVTYFHVHEEILKDYDRKFLTLREIYLCIYLKDLFVQ